MHAARQHEVITYRHAFGELRDVILLPDEFVCPILVPEITLGEFVYRVDTGYFHKSSIGTQRALPSLQRWTHCLPLPPVECELAWKSWTFLPTISPIRRARAISPIAKCTVSMHPVTRLDPMRARRRPSRGSSPPGLIFRKELPSPPAILWTLLWWEKDF